MTFKNHPLSHTPAYKLLRLFGGARKLAQAITEFRANQGIEKPHVFPSRIYKWVSSKDKQGTGGAIPSGALDEINGAAKLMGIEINWNYIFGGGNESR